MKIKSSLSDRAGTTIWNFYSAIKTSNLHSLNISYN